MSYIINGVEVKVGQVWEQRDGCRCEIVEILQDPLYPIRWISISDMRDVVRSCDKYGQEFDDAKTASDLFRLVSEPVITINQPEEQSMTRTPNLQIEDLRKTAEEPQYKTWGDLPDGTFVLDEYGDVYVVNKHHNSAAYCLDGGRVHTKAHPYSSKNKIIKVKLQILE